MVGHGESVPEASPKGESKSNGEVEGALQSEQKSGIALESRSPLLAWLVDHRSNLLLLHAFERQSLEN